MSETCWICEDEARGTSRVVSSEDSAPLCNRHWNLWIARYLFPSELVPPCGAHVIAEPDSSGSREGNTP